MMFVMPGTMFFGCKMLEKSSRKANLEVCGRLPYLVFDLKKVHLQDRVYLCVSVVCVSVIQALFSACIQAAFIYSKDLLMRVWKDRLL